VPVADVSDAPTGLTAGDYHTCAILSDGSADCWGDNHFGEIGDRTTVDRLAPVDVLFDVPAVDSAIRRAGETAWSGAGTVDGSGADEGTTIRLHPGDTARFFIRIENEASFDESYVVSAPWVGGALQVHYRFGSTDVSFDINGHGWSTPVVPPGGSILLKLHVHAGAHAVNGCSIRVAAASAASSGVLDVVRAIVRIS
jgi:hypothetical protein